jgi:hypothetical protein
MSALPANLSLGSVFAVLVATAALLASCATSSMVTQQSNPDYVGKPFKSVMVVAVTADELVRRTFEDRMVALLGQRRVKGVPSYSVIGSRKVEEAELRRAIAASGVEAVLITRVTRVDRSTGTLPGATVGIGFYGYWETVHLPPEQVNGPSWTVSETRLFDAKNGVLAWTGVMDTRENNDLDGALTQYINVVFDAMVRDRVL